MYSIAVSIACMAWVFPFDWGIVLVQMNFYDETWIADTFCHALCWEKPKIASMSTFNLNIRNGIQFRIEYNIISEIF